jgi:hypothetical protein
VEANNGPSFVYKYGTTGTGTPAVPFGYFDQIQAASNYGVNLGAVTPSNWIPNTWMLYDANYNQIGTATGNPSFIDTSAYDAPFQAQAYGSQPGNGAAFFTSYPLSFWPGDVYNLATYDFGFKAQTFTPGETTDRQDAMALSGKRQSVFFYAKDILTLVFNGLSDSQRQTFEAFWAYARQGVSFGVAVDWASIYFSLVQGGNISGSTITVTVSPTLSVAKGTPLRLKSIDRTLQDGGIVSTVSGNVITLATVQNGYGLLPAQIQTDLYYPFVILTDQDLTWTPADPKVKRWNLTMNLEEAL